MEPLRASSTLAVSQPGAGPYRAASRRPDDPALLEALVRSAGGDGAAFATLYDHTSSRVYGMILRVVKSPDHAAEVTQDVYIEVWRQAGRYDPSKGSVTAWMITIARRRAVDRVRSVVAMTARDQRYTDLNLVRDFDHVWDVVAERLDAERLQDGLSRVSGTQRQAITLAYLGGHTHSQIAELLTIPLGTVKARIRDGMRNLRMQMH